MLGKNQSVRVRSKVLTNPDLTLRYFEFEFGSQDGVFRTAGGVESGWLSFTNAGREQRLKLARELYPIEALGRVIVERRPAPGTKLNYLVFDGTVLDTMPVAVEVLGTELVRFADTSLSTLKVRVRRAKFDVNVWLDQRGITVKEESPIGMNSHLVPEQEAIKGEDGYLVDVLKIFAVPVDTLIAKPEKVRRVVFEVTGIDTVEFKLGWSYQRVVSRSPFRIEIVVPEVSDGIKLPLQEELEYLRPSPLVPSDAAPIKKQAQEIIAQTNDAVIAARRIMSWVFNSVAKEAVASLPNALTVLKERKGDCNEHSVLYAALARAVGIPAKVVVGLVYLDGAFYYHAWNEVYLDGWVPVDPTFGQFPANALRLKLAEGDLSRQAEVLGVVKKIGIRVLEFSSP